MSAEPYKEISSGGDKKQVFDVDLKNKIVQQALEARSKITGETYKKPIFEKKESRKINILGKTFTKLTQKEFDLLGKLPKEKRKVLLQKILKQN